MAAVLLLEVGCFASLGLAQEGAGKPKKEPLPVIPDEPRAIDPATLVPGPLAVKKTADLQGATLSEVSQWLEKECQVEVLIDKAAVAQKGVLPTDPVGENLKDTPVYLFLDRLRRLDLYWYYANNIVYITSQEKFDERLVMVPYNVGDLLDAGYEIDSLVETINTTVAPDSWIDVGGDGVMNVIGDVLFVRQDEEIQRKLQGLLQALRGPGRRTFTYDPPENQQIRERLKKPITVSFREIALTDAVSLIAKEAEIDIRLNQAILRQLGIRERTPVSLELTDTPVDVVLNALLQDLQLTWILRDGALSITTPEKAKAYLVTAVFDVRDLCSDASESEALVDAISSQDGNEWEALGGPGSLAMAKSGTLVIRHREAMLTDVLNLLEAYRTALKGSKPRVSQDEDPNEVITVYYRTQANVAQGLNALLPELVRPESWKSPKHPDAPGVIFSTASEDEIISSQSGSGKESSSTRVLIPQAVLIITQTRGCHEEIAEVLNRVEHGDSLHSGGMGAMGGGGGGFGGMF
ncbi:hypothetical protein DTL42_19175 [Bremerella cremea]|uniref:Uncharacterized protein n=1 Tax=Bremerella cremea TaxID=1031537 RepID=A0A368KPM6_9BACT|nr:hypothetical protein DTL42_19175 [Bremerella cremea]